MITLICAMLLLYWALSGRRWFGAWLDRMAKRIEGRDHL